MEAIQLCSKGRQGALTEYVPSVKKSGLHLRLSDLRGGLGRTYLGLAQSLASRQTASRGQMYPIS